MNSPDREPPKGPETSGSLHGLPPIPPHNKPPVLAATGSGELPDPDDHRVIRCNSEDEAQGKIRQMGYFVTRIHSRKQKESHEAAPRPQPSVTAQVRYALASLFYDAVERVRSIFDFELPKTKRGK